MLKTIYEPLQEAEYNRADFHYVAGKMAQTWSGPPMNAAHPRIEAIDDYDLQDLGFTPVVPVKPIRKRQGKYASLSNYGTF